MDVSPVDPKTIYGSYGQMQVSHDGGASWSVAGEPPPDMIAIAASSLKAERVFAATKGGLYLSEDGGATWKAAGFEGEIVSLVKTGAGKSIYAFVLGRGLMKADEDNPDQWATLSNGFGEAIPLHLAIDPAEVTHLALTTQSNDVFESRDGGTTWKPFGPVSE